MEEQKKVNKETEAKELIKSIKDIEQLEQAENLVKDNKICFEDKDISYRVRKINIVEQREILKFRRKKYSEFINDDSMMFQKQWVEKYKTKGIDLNKMDQEMFDIQKQIENLYIKLATKAGKESVEDLKNQILECKAKQATLSIEKTDLLSYSIEDSLAIEVCSYYAYLVLENLVDKKWIKTYKDYEEFQNSKDSKVINKALYYSHYLMYEVE